MGSLIVQVVMVSLVMLIYFAVNLPFEKWRPVGTNNLRNSFLNIAHGVTFHAIELGVGVSFSVWLTSLAAHLPFYGFLDLGIRDRGSLWLSLPLAFETLAIQDFFYYWMHRLEHRSRWMWAIHELHHSDEHLNVTSGIRHHQLEVFTKAIFIIVPMAILFRLPITTAGWAAFLTQAFTYFVHANARIGFGPFSRVLANPQVHRIHHSKSPEHIDKNFAAFFPIWDVIFGTYYHPRPGEYPATGLTSGKRVRTVSGAALMPFKTWAGMLTRPN